MGVSESVEQAYSVMLAGNRDDMRPILLHKGRNAAATVPIRTGVLRTAYDGEADLSHPIGSPASSIGAINARSSPAAPEVTPSAICVHSGGWAGGRGSIGVNAVCRKGGRCRAAVGCNQMSSQSRSGQWRSGFFTPRFPAPWRHPPGTIEGPRLRYQLAESERLERLIVSIASTPAACQNLASRAQASCK